MAKSIARHKQLRGISTASDEPGVALSPLPMWAPPTGMDTVSRLSRLGPQAATLLKNFRLREQTIVVRAGLSAASIDSTTGIMGVVNFVTSDGLGQLIRFKVDAVEWLNETTWIPISVPGGLSGSSEDFFTYTAYNDKMLFSNGIDGIFEWDFLTMSIIKIEEAPACRFLTTFGGRVIASYTFENGTFYPTRIRWSVKNNSHDWEEVAGDLTGEGAGFEDLLSTPGGNVDQQRGVYPISDYAALIIRSRSTWQMTETGNPDAPFRFTRIYSEMGTESPHSITTVAGGVIGLMNDDVYLISGSDIQPLGTKVRRTIFEEVTNLAHVIGAYDFDEHEFALLVPTSTGTKIWRYSQRNPGWTVDEFPFELKWLSFTKSSLVGLTIDSSTGIIDDAGNASIDSEVGVDERKGMYYASDSRIYHDDETTTQDDGVDSAIEATTAAISASSPLEKTVVTEIQMEYEGAPPTKGAGQEVIQTLEFEYKEPTTSGWQTYESNVQIAPTSVPQVLSVRKTVVGHNLQLRVRSATLGKLRILAFVPMVNIAQNEARG